MLETSDGSSWRFVAERLNGDGTATLLDPDLPVSSPEITETDSAVDQLTFTVTPEIARLVASDGKPLLDEWSTAVYAEKDGDIRAGTILVHSGFTGPSWDIECAGFIGYAKDMPYTGSGEFFVKTDTLDIARFIWSHIQAQNGSDIGLEFSQRKSGVLVGSTLTSDQYDPEGGSGGLELESQAYKLAYYQDHDLLSNFDDLASETPFVYREHHFWDGDTIRHRVDFPTSIQYRWDLRFAIGENVIVPPAYTRDGDQYASETYFLGAGEGARTVRGHAVKPRTRLRRVAIRTDASVRRLSAANNLAQMDLNTRSNLEDLDEIVVQDHEHARIGAVVVGDLIRVLGYVGWLGDVDGWYKVIAIKYAPGSSQQTLSLARADKVLFRGDDS